MSNRGDQALLAPWGNQQVPGPLLFQRTGYKIHELLGTNLNPAVKGKSAGTIPLILPRISACDRIIKETTGNARDYVLPWLNFIFL